MKRILFIIAALFATAQSQTIQTIGAPTTTVVSRGNFRTDSIFYLPKRQKLPTDSGAVRYQISDSSVYYWTGSQWRRLGVYIDTASMLNPYLRGSGTANYFPKFDASRSVINSKLYESGTNLLFNTTNPSFTSSGITTIENNATSSAVYTYKIADTIRAYMGYGGASTFDINNLRAGDIRFYTSATLRGRFQTDGTFRLNSLTGTGSRIVTADADGVLSATSSATGLVDTLVLSTRAWRQKGDDSLGAIIATKGSGTVTSVATGYGLSGGTITTTGTITADTLQLSTRAWRQKGLDSLAALEISGSGTNNYVPKFTDTRIIGNSQIFDNGTNVGIGTTSMAAKFHVIGGGIFESANTGGVITQFRNSTIESLGYIGVEGNTGGIQLTGTTANATFVASGATGRNLQFGTGGVIRATLNPNGELLLNTTTDAGDYKLQVSGNAYVTGTTVLAATSGNVGVGTASPAQKLDVSGITRVNGGTIYAQSSGTESGQYQLNALTLGYDATNAVGWITAGGAAARTNLILQEGGGSTTAFVGIGTRTPTEKLHVSGNIYNTSSTYFNAISGESYFGTTTDAGDYKLQVSGNAYVTGTTVLAATSGNVGIGTTPSYPLHVKGPALDYVGVFFANTQYLALGQYNVASGTMSVETGGNLAFLSGGATEGMRLTSARELLIGTTTDAGDYKLQVSGNAYVTGTTVLAATSGNVGIGTASPSSSLEVSKATNAILTVRQNTSPGASEYAQIALIHGTTFFGASDKSYQIISNALSTGEADFAVQYWNGSTFNERYRVTSSGELLINTTSDAGDYKLQVNGNVANNGTYTSGAPTDGTAAPWKLGSYITTAPTATGFVQVEINGVKYKLLAATY